MTVLFNTSNAAIDLDDFGMTIPALGTADISHIRAQIIANCAVLIENVTNAVIAVVNQQADPTSYWSIDDGLAIIELGVNGAQVGISKPTRPGIIEGNYYGPTTDAPLIDDTVPANHLNAIPVNYLGEQFNRIGVSITTPGVANSFCRLGVYENNDGFPGKLLLDAGVVPCDTTGNKEIIIDFQTPSDWCFLSTLTSDLTNALSVASQLSVCGNTGNNVTDVTRHIHTDYTATDGFPDMFPNTAVASTNYPPFVWFRKV
jgi:hypothetical protein